MSLDLWPNKDGEVIDRQCPNCGAFVSEHKLVMKTTVRRGVKTIEEMRALPPDWFVLECPR